MLNRLTGVVSCGNGVPAASFQYGYNAANQRTAVTNGTGGVIGPTDDALGQVTNAAKKWGDNTLVAGQQFGYGFDTIGNRTMTLGGGGSNGSEPAPGELHGEQSE